MTTRERNRGAGTHTQEHFPGKGPRNSGPRQSRKPDGAPSVKRNMNTLPWGSLLWPSNQLQECKAIQALNH